MVHALGSRDGMCQKTTRETKAGLDKMTYIEQGKLVSLHVLPKPEKMS